MHRDLPFSSITSVSILYTVFRILCQEKNFAPLFQKSDMIKNEGDLER
jgi:hypothetical protein